MEKTVEDVERIVTLQLEAVKNRYAKTFGSSNPKWYQKRANELNGQIKALAWVKVFAIQDKSYNPKQIKEREY